VLFDQPLWYGSWAWMKHSNGNILSKNVNLFYHLSYWHTFQIYIFLTFLLLESNNGYIWNKLVWTFSCLQMKQCRKNIWFYVTRHWLELANQWHDNSCDSTWKKFWWLDSDSKGLWLWLDKYDSGTSLLIASLLLPDRAKFEPNLVSTHQHFR